MSRSELLDTVTNRLTLNEVIMLTRISRNIICLSLIVAYTAELACAEAAASSTTMPVAAMDGVTDQTDLLQRTIDGLPDGAVLNLPPGTMILSKPVLVRAKSFTLRGAGAFATRLRWVAKGGLHCSDTRTLTEAKGRLAAWEISDLQFEAGVANAGTALALAPQSARLTPSVYVHDCDFEPAMPGDYWTISIDVLGGHLGRITDCYFRGNPDRGLSHFLTPCQAARAKASSMVSRISSLIGP